MLCALVRKPTHAKLGNRVADSWIVTRGRRNRVDFLRKGGVEVLWRHASRPAKAIRLE